VKIEFMVSWVAVLCSVVVGYHHFGELCRLHLQDNMILQNGTAIQKTTSSII